ncbi:MAG: hypothetical protein IE909_07010 [Campylobacterales bacterium]|nr:hypothetical protein [Campylobacterales bacterium]
MKHNEIEKPEEYLKLLESKKESLLYHDHPNDGIEVFQDAQTEDIGWHACSFDFLNYRVLAKFIEENCDGTFTYCDNPLGFNGFVEVDDIVTVRQQLKNFCIEQIKANKLDSYDNDQIKALKFFGIN